MSSNLTTTHHAIIFFLLLLSLVLLRTCNPPTKPSLPAAATSMPALLPFLSGVLVFTLIRPLFLRIKPAAPPTPTPGPLMPTRETGGVSGQLLNSLPVFTYSSEKPPGFGRGAGRGMCAICLSGFRDGQALRWLPDCGHLFHRRCVDAWLGSHKTCPCCRGNVERRSASSGGGTTLVLEDGGGDPPAPVGGDRRRSGSPATERHPPPPPLNYPPQMK